jgi:hypothetical protein
MTLSLLLLQDQHSVAQLDEEPEEDLLDKMTESHSSRHAGWRAS